MIRCIFLLLCILAVTTLAQAQAPDRLPLIDAHSQIDPDVDQSEIVSLLNKAGIAHVILAARNKVKPHHIADLARKHPDRITASMRTKGKAYNNNHPKYYKLLNKQANMSEFNAMAELIIWHAQKGNKAPEVILPFDSEQVLAAFSIAKERGWPFVVHIEFRAAGNDGPKYLSAFEDLARTNKSMKFVLIHMAQLNAGQVRKLIQSHPNVYFMTSHTTPPSVRKTNQPWTILFEGKNLKPEWKKLMSEHSDRFVFALDNVWLHHWYEEFQGQAKLWRNALGELPLESAHAIAHKNAESLWNLTPVK
ncbi:MAG TPA: hypothetical protein EYQ26_00110 [Rhodospirillales bacterium]|nr:hypothetical protein [Rhodospirillales bacterium]HIL74521.1 hypothetical protein [Rhodospirillales bacterium]